jgi:gamma-glutamylcyclotransferase (GGCT)/AIG2-like uncharacterized protein YtfP
MPTLRYFAYGRNMAASAMALACPGHRYLGPAQLRDHRLAFTRRSLRTGTGVADAIEAAGEHVWGALYELQEADLAALDEKEGNGWAYERRSVRVAVGAGAELLEAFAYRVIEPDGAHIQPSPEYREALLTGARERGLPSGYVKALAALAAFADSRL